MSSESQRRWRAAHPDRHREHNRRWREANRENVAEYDRQRLARERALVFRHYGTWCQCCGSEENLSIDHVHGGGAAHRAEVGLGEGGSEFYHWLIQNHFPPGYQTLCMPCNSSKGDGERCRIHEPLDW